MLAIVINMTMSWQQNHVVMRIYYVCSSYVYDQKLAADSRPSFVVHVTNVRGNQIGTGRYVSVIPSAVSPSS
jgi:hypothetical protein